jgi:RNA binding exosome subunit
MNFRELNGKSIRDAFKEFHEKNPKLYIEFEKQAFRAINAGRTKISAKMIINYIRWNVFIESTDTNFKLNDAFGSYYSRLFTSIHPEHEDKFEFRKLRNESPGPYMYVGPTGQISFV